MPRGLGSLAHDRLADFAEAVGIDQSEPDEGKPFGSLRRFVVETEDGGERVCERQILILAPGKRQHRAPVIGDHGVEQIGLGGKEPIEGALGDAAARRNLVHPGAAVTGFEEELARRDDDALPLLRIRTGLRPAAHPHRPGRAVLIGSSSRIRHGAAFLSLTEGEIKR